MREIKLRGYRNYVGNQLYPADKRWIYGYYSFRDRQHWIQNIDDMNMTYVVEPTSVGEFTGLKDKNGKEIYEGDIVRKPDVFGNLLTGVIEYEAPFYWAMAKSRWFSVGDKCEVIGNIYENPELLKGEK